MCATGMYLTCCLRYDLNQNSFLLYLQNIVHFCTKPFYNRKLERIRSIEPVVYHRINPTLSLIFNTSNSSHLVANT